MDSKDIGSAKVPTFENVGKNFEGTTLVDPFALVHTVQQEATGATQ